MAPTFTSISSDNPANPLENQLILLGVGGGIAAYKACELARLLVKAGADVHVLMTQSATEFVTPLTFAALTHNPVRTTLFDADTETAMAHTELGMKAKAFVIAPATANLLGTFAHGLANDLVSTTLLVSQCPTLICPAMNSNMWENQQVRHNIETLEGNPRYHIMSPGEGELACGVIGAGRLPEPDQIFNRLKEILQDTSDPRLKGKKVLISGGPTREYLDPVRFLSNPASGTLATQMAQSAQERGANVTLVMGPTNLSAPPGVESVRVTSAEEMAQEILSRAPDTDLLCMAAAVADWRPETMHETKQHKQDSAQDLRLVRTRDILKSVQNLRGPKPKVLGFAAETESDSKSLIMKGLEKLKRKGCDLLFVNPVHGEDFGFGSGKTKGFLLGPGKQERNIGVVSKVELARTLIDASAALFEENERAVEEIA